MFKIMTSAETAFFNLVLAMLNTAFKLSLDQTIFIVTSKSNQFIVPPIWILDQSLKLSIERFLSSRENENRMDWRMDNPKT